VKSRIINFLPDREVLVLGVDPGWSSFGYCLSIIGGEGPGRRVRSGNLVPKEATSANDFIEDFVCSSGVAETGLETLVTIERFVAYENIHSSVNEPLLMLIGGLSYALRATNICDEVNLTRAIDWKPALCKFLVRNLGFSNPYNSFDKKYSILAANTILEAFYDEEEPIKVDHEADALCLGFMPIVWEEEKKRKSSGRRK
jgi:hypothetical protein